MLWRAETPRNLDKKKALAIDLGVDNLATCVINNGKSFIVDGRRLKSINQWYNKQNARLQFIKNEQKLQKRIIKDVNGALNILRKSKVVSLDTLYHRGEVDTPIRIRIA